MKGSTSFTTKCKKVEKPPDTLGIEVLQFGGMPRRVAAHVAANTFVIPRNHAANVTCRAVTGPQNDAGEHAEVAWAINPAPLAAPANGQTVNVATNACGQFTVTATYRGLVASVDIWVIWFNLAISLTDNTNIPARCLVDFSAPNTAITANPRVLGRREGLVNGIYNGAGRVCLTGTLLPAGAHVVVTNSVRMRRTIIDEKTSTDGADFVHRQNIADHTTRQDKRQWVPNAPGEVFDLDAPNIAYWHPANACIETYMHFRQHVTYDGHVCSGNLDWHFIGEVLFGNLGVALQANPVVSQVVHLVQPNPCPAVIPRMVVAAGALNVAGIAAPRYAVAVNVAGGYDITNHGEKP